MPWKIEIHLEGKDKYFIQITLLSSTKKISNIIPSATEKKGSVKKISSGTLHPYFSEETQLNNDICLHGANLYTTKWMGE